MPFAPIGGRRIYFDIEGNGEQTIMFANSLGTSLDIWDMQARGLAEKYRILRFDMRGHGKSDPEPATATVDQLAADTLAVLDEARCPSVHFVGLSLGGMVGQLLALDAAGRIQSLTLCATAAHLPPPESWEGRARTALDQGIEPLVDASRSRWFTPAFFKSSSERAERAFDMLRQVDPPTYAACCRAIRDFDVRDRLARISAPVQLIAGSEDPSTPPDRLLELHRAILHSEIAILQGAAHILNYERPQEVTELISSFVARHSLPTRGGAVR